MSTLHYLLLRARSASRQLLLPLQPLFQAQAKTSQHVYLVCPANTLQRGRRSIKAARSGHPGPFRPAVNPSGLAEIQATGRCPKFQKA